MSPRRMKLGLLTVAVITVSVGLNLMVMQPGGGRGARPERAYRGLDTLPGSESTAIKAPVVHPGHSSPRDRAMRSSQAPLPIDADEPSAARADAQVTRAVQSALAARGYYQGEANGVAGIVTRAAIMEFEQLNGLPLSAEPSAELVKVLASAASRDVAIRASVPRMNGISVGAEAEVVIKTIQRSLDRLGYAPGIADGKFGDATAAAIRAFEQDSATEVTGRISAALVMRLADRTSAGRVAASD